jgi:hypothetical protein
MYRLATDDVYKDAAKFTSKFDTIAVIVKILRSMMRLIRKL